MTGADRPIFIGGLSHSGKTPLRRVLGAHPDISMTRKTRLWERFYGRFGDLGRPANLARCLEAILRDPGIQQLEPDADRLRRDLAHGPATYARIFALLHQHHAERAGKRRWGDQLGLVERFADPIFAAFPRARMIHMIRDPRDRPVLGPTTRPRRAGQLGWEIGLWLRSAELADRNTHRYPRRYRMVRYEAFAARPVETVEALCAFLGEEYVPPMADVLRTITLDDGRDGSATPGARQPPRLSPAEVSLVNQLARRRLVGLGYDGASPVLSARERVAVVLVDRPLGYSGLGVERALQHRRAGG